MAVLPDATGGVPLRRGCVLPPVSGGRCPTRKYQERFKLEMVRASFQASAVGRLPGRSGTLPELSARLPAGAEKLPGPFGLL